MSVNDSGIEPESPHIKRLDPESGPFTGGGTSYVYGLHFQALLDVSFGKDNKADPAQVSVTPDGTLITVNSVPPAPIAANDQLIVGVTVRTQPAGSSVPLTSNAVNFTYKQS